MTKYTFVLPRYGEEILGGAEQAARVLAESIASRPGCAMEILTTCALDAGTFANAYAPGTTTENGVVVHRFPCTGRAVDFDRRSQEILHSSRELMQARSAEWVAAQGPVSTQLIDALADTDADVLAFHPYLYHPTVVGIRAVTDRPRILHPAAHDERPILLPVFDEVFDAADGVVFWSRQEQAFANYRFAIGATPQMVLGIGVTPMLGDVPAARASVGVGDAPYVLCLGRVDTSKGTDLLVGLFEEYKRRYPGPEKLVMAGPVRHQPPAHPDLIVTGAVDDHTKWGLLRGAEVMISPSPLESFSIVLLESWMSGTPVLVNGACDTTREHVLASNGGLWFSAADEFVPALRRLLTDQTLRTQCSNQGRAYVESRYVQDVLTTRYLAFCERLRTGIITPTAPIG